jgi:uncharacterized protein (TIGR03382 family)
VRAGLLGGVLAVLLAATGAYVRNTTADGSHCLHWAAGPVTLAQSIDGDAQLGEPGFDAVTRAWQTWQAQMQACGDLVISESPRSTSRTVGFLPDGGTENLVLFRTALCTAVVDAGDPCQGSGSCGNLHDCWDHTSGVIALTTTTYRRADGVIVDADVELNAAQSFFTVVDSPPCDPSAESLDCVANDTQETVTHEFGHLLGLAHSPDPDSTMYAYAPVGETSKRTLDPASQQFVCDVYPHGRSSQDCLAADGGPVSQGGCSTAGTGVAPVLLLGSLTLVGLLWRRHRR